MNIQANSLSYLEAFLGGAAMSLTPCVYPLLPVILGYIGVESNSSKRKGFLLSWFYVTGIAITYSVLGLVASLSGQIFGRISSSPITYIFFALVLIIFSLSTFDVLPTPHLQLIKFPFLKKKTYLSVLFLGLCSGLVISPCLTPILGGILLYLAAKKNILYGTALLFSFAYGLGLIFILGGTFSALLVSLPKSGKWMLWVKMASAFVLLGMGMYFIFLAIRRM